MKIALLGSAPSSLHRAPFRNEDYQRWIQGRTEQLARAHGDVPGNFDIWACSPGCWAGAPRASRWFEVHRWEPHQTWFSPEYVRFLQEFKGPVYTGARVPEVPNHVVYPIDRLEEKFSSYFMTSSLALMLALAIDTIEQIRAARRTRSAHDAGVPTTDGASPLPPMVDPAELERPDSDDIIGMWGVDMAANEEYGYQRPGCQFFILEAMRRGIAVYLPPESDLMRPMPVYGVSEWDHNYIKLTTRARELNAKVGQMQKEAADHHTQIAGGQGEMQALNHFVNTWTSPYGMQHGLVIRQDPGTGLGSGITHVDGRPVSRIGPHAEAPAGVLEAMRDSPDAQLGRALTALLIPHAGNGGTSEGAADTLERVLRERGEYLARAEHLEHQCQELAGRIQRPATPRRRTNGGATRRR